MAIVINLACTAFLFFALWVVWLCFDWVSGHDYSARITAFAFYVFLALIIAPTTLMLIWSPQ